jgi:hypothetical protein
MIEPYFFAYALTGRFIIAGFSAGRCPVFLLMPFQGKYLFFVTPIGIYNNFAYALSGQIKIIESGI